MKPTDIGLPAKFREFRKGQYEIALDAAASDKRFCLLSSPTGSGKSLIYMAIAKLVDARTLVLTSSKGLQQQLMHDFGAAGLADIKGQNNYPCIATQEGGDLSEYAPVDRALHCDEGPCHFGVRCDLSRGEDGLTRGCAYDTAVDEARGAGTVVTNYTYWMTMGRHADPDALGKFDLLVLDEAHDAPDELANFCAVRLDRGEVHALTGMALPPLDEGVEVWSGWASSTLKIAKRYHAEVRAKLGTPGSDRRKAGRLLKRLSDLAGNLTELARAHTWKRVNPSDPHVYIPGMETDWVAETTTTGALFSPVWAHAYAEEYLFRAVPRVVLVSAVLQKSVARYLGIADRDFHYREFQSTFDPKRRPLIYVPTTTVDRNMTEGQIRIWLNRMDAIIGGRLDRKGIIHTRSYDRARLIMARSRHRDIMVTHTTRTTRHVVDQFKRMAAPCILVSPSVEEGFDFPYSACSYQILAKVPFVDMRSRIMQARSRSDKVYPNYLAALSLIQQVGRGMRAEDDICENFIIDDHIAWFWRAARGIFPSWFRSAWRQDSSVQVAPDLPIAWRRRGVVS